MFFLFLKSVFFIAKIPDFGKLLLYLIYGPLSPKVTVSRQEAEFVTYTIFYDYDGVFKREKNLKAVGGGLGWFLVKFRELLADEYVKNIRIK